MAISSDGRWLHLLKANYEIGSSAYSLLTFDTLNLHFTPEEQFMPDCPRPRILVISGGRKARVQNYAAGWDGLIQEVNTATNEITRTSTGGHLLRSRHLMPSSGTLSSDGRFWYLPAKIPDNGEQGIEQIVVFDTQAMTPTNVITPDTPFWGLALSSDGKWLYASQPERNAISVIDTATGRISRMLPVLGKPSVVFVSKRP